MRLNDLRELNVASSTTYMDFLESCTLLQSYRSEAPVELEKGSAMG